MLKPFFCFTGFLKWEYRESQPVSMVLRIDGWRLSTRGRANNKPWMIINKRKWMFYLCSADNGCVTWYQFYIQTVKTQCTFSVGVEGAEPMFGRGMLSTSSKTFWIFWSEILMCSSGSSPESLNLNRDRLLFKDRWMAAIITLCTHVLGHSGVVLHHALCQLHSEVHGLEDMLHRGGLQKGRLPGLS